MPGFGLAGAAGFASGFGPAFNQSLHQSQELQLERQRLQMQQDRERNAKAEDDRARLYDVISKHAQAMRAMNQDPKLIMKTLEPNISALERLTKSLGRDPTLIRMEFGMMLSEPTYKDVLGEDQQTAGAQGQTAQRPQPGGGTGPVQQAATDAAFSQAPSGVMPGQPMPQGPSPAAPGVQPVPFMQGDVGGAAQPSATGTMPPPPPEVEAPQEPAKSIPERLYQEKKQDNQQKLERLTQAEQLALSRGDKAHAEYFRDQRRQLMKDSAGSHVEVKQAPDGSYLFIHKDTGQILDENGKVYHTPTDEGAKSFQILKNMNITPEQFEFNAQKLAYGDQSILTGLTSRGGPKAIAYAQMLKGRAAQIFMDKGMSAQQANAVTAEFAAMKYAGHKVGGTLATMTSALSRAQGVAPIVSDLSDKIDRTQYPSINALILAAKKGTGDENVIRLGIAVETLVSAYASALGMSNSALTDFQTKRAQELLELAYSQGQMRAAVDQMQIELKRELQKQKEVFPALWGASTTTGGKGSEDSGDEGEWKIEKIK